MSESVRPSVRLLVMTMYCGKTAGPIEMPFGMWGGVGDSHHVLDRGLDPPTERDNFGMGRGRPIVKYRDLSLIHI